jgi:hypothetical protein
MDYKIEGTTRNWLLHLVPVALYLQSFFICFQMGFLAKDSCYKLWYLNICNHSFNLPQVIFTNSYALKVNTKVVRVAFGKEIALSLTITSSCK